MPRRKSLKRMKVTITQPKHVIDAIDELAKLVETTRSGVIEAFIEHCLNDKDIIDTVFPFEVEIVEDEREEDEEAEDEESA